MPYGVIYADPPWGFKTHSEKGLGRSADAHYDTMSLEDIKALPVADLAAPDCVLLLWVTDPFLFKAKEVIDAWKFEYKTVGFYWAKSPLSWFGTGYWTRANPELCLLATRGHPKRQNAGVRKLVVSPRREHSRKPDEIHSYIERLCVGPYLELFARTRYPNWDVAFSNQAETGISDRRWGSSSYPTRNLIDEIEL